MIHLKETYFREEKLQRTKIESEYESSVIRVLSRVFDTVVHAFN